MRPSWLSIAGVTVAFVLAGCGSSTTRTVTASTTTATVAHMPITKAQFIEKADAICADVNAKEAPLDNRIKTAENEPEAQELLDLIPPLRQEIALTRAGSTKLAALPKPPADVRTIGKLETAYGEQETDVANLADAITAKDVAGIEAAQAAARKAKSYSDGLAQGYGFTVCGKHEE